MCGKALNGRQGRIVETWPATIVTFRRDAAEAASELRQSRTSAFDNFSNDARCVKV